MKRERPALIRRPVSLKLTIARTYLALAIYCSYLMGIQMFDRSLIHASEIDRQQLLNALTDGAFYFFFQLTANPLCILAFFVIMICPSGQRQDRSLRR